MRTILILMLLTAFSVSGWAQDSNWESKIAENFYLRISRGRRLECCDKGSKVKQICVDVDLPDQCYPRMDFSLKQYVEESIDSVIIERTVRLLEKKYLRKFSARKRLSLKKSCYAIYVLESVVEDAYQDAVFVSGKLRVIINFQTK